jgi:hypothetical protein
LVIFACGESAEKPQKNTTEAVRVRLPKAPDLTTALPPAQWDDQVYSVRGALQNATELKNQEVTIRGTVVEVRMCDDPDEWKCMLPSHILLTDDLNRSAKRIAIIGNRLQEIEALQIGQKLDQLTGTMATVSRDGRLVAMEGLINLEPVEKKPKRRSKRRKARKKRSKNKRIDIKRP